MAKVKDIGARLMLQDNMTTVLRGVRKEQQAFRNDLKSTGSMLKKTFDKDYKVKLDNRDATAKIRQTRNTLKVLGSMVVKPTIEIKDKVTSGLGKIKDQFMSLSGLAVGVGAGLASYGLFDKTIGASAKMELSQTQIKAMMRNDNLANQYMTYMQDKAIQSPVLNSQEMFQYSSGFVSQFKDMNNLKKAWNVAEILTAINPLQGVEGATYALKNLFGGQDQSIVDRFDLKKQDMNAIKDLKPDKQLDALSKYFKGMGYDMDFINKSASTAIGLWNQIGEKSSKAMQQMGTRGLLNIKPELDKFNNWLDSSASNSLVKFGSDMIGGLTKSAVDGVESAKTYIDQHFNNDKFKNMDYKAKITFVVSDLWGTFKNWFDTTGSKQVADMTSFVLRDIGSYLVDHSDDIAKGGVAIGASLIKAIGKSAMESMPTLIHTLGQKLSSIRDDFANWVNGNDSTPSPKPKPSNKPFSAMSIVKNSGSLPHQSFSNGLGGKLIPHNAKGTNNWKGGPTWVGEQGPEIVNLPRGSQVIPNNQSMQLSSSSGGISVIIPKLAEQIVIREEADIDKFVNKLVPRIKLTLANM